MNKEMLFEAFCHINENYVYEAHSSSKKQHFIKIKWLVTTACICLIIGVIIRIGVAFVPSQATDIFREGNLIEITKESELPTTYDGKLLAFNLDFKIYELYYRTDGVADNIDDWYSLLASRYDTKGDIVLHCMFGETSIEDWKVGMVFTKAATHTVEINGVNVQIAKTKHSLKYQHWYYAIFEYDDVVYDIRVQSDNAEYIYEVLNQLLGDL